MTVCKSCGAEIKWIKLSSGKVHPVDPDPAYYLKFVGIGKRIFVTETGEIERGEYCNRHAYGAVKGYTSHFATCPYADQHRKGGT